MEQTKNFGLNLPDITDPADVRPLNENFEKIDEELEKFYDLFKDGGYRPSFDLSAREETVDVTGYLDFTEIYAAASANKIIRIWFEEANSKDLCYALLTSLYDSDSSAFFCGLVSMPYYNSSYAEFVLVYSKENETFSLRHYGDFPRRFLDNVKDDVVEIVKDTAGSTAVCTHLDLSNWDSGSFVVEWDSGDPTNCTVEFDETGRPISLSDGDTPMTITWPTEEATA